MTKYQKSSIIVLLGLIIFSIIGVSLYIRKSVAPSSAIVLNNGKSYIYFEYPSEHQCWVNGIDFMNDSISQIRSVLDTDVHPTFVSGTVSSAEQAAYFGASALDEVFEEWTEVNEVGVCHNRIANVWVIHGLLKDRYSHTDIGIVVLDAVTGDVIGATLYLPSTQT